MITFTHILICLRFWTLLLFVTLRLFYDLPRLIYTTFARLFTLCLPSADLFHTLFPGRSIALLHFVPGYTSPAVRCVLDHTGVLTAYRYALSFTRSFYVTFVLLPLRSVDLRCSPVYTSTFIHRTHVTNTHLIFYTPTVTRDTCRLV